MGFSRKVSSETYCESLFDLQKFEGPLYSLQNLLICQPFVYHLILHSHTHRIGLCRTIVCQKSYSNTFSRGRNQGIHMPFSLCLYLCNTFGAYSVFKCGDIPSCFQTISSRRGLPATSISDNVKTFKSTSRVKSTSREASTIARSPEVFRYLSNHQTSWRFIVAKAA